MNTKTSRNFILFFNGEVIAHYNCKSSQEAEQFFANNLSAYGLNMADFQSDNCKIKSYKG